MNLALNPFDRGKKPESVDKVELDKEFLEKAEFLIKVYGWGNPDKYDLHDYDDHVLNYVLRNTEYRRSRLDFYEEVIRQAYVHGHDEWHLDGIDQHDFLGNLTGNKKLPLKFTITGNLGASCMRNIKFCDVVVNGRVFDSFAVCARYCNIYVRESWGSLCFGASYSTVKAEKAGHECCRQACDVECEVKEAGQAFGNEAHRCVFKAEKADHWSGNNAENCKFFVNEVGDYFGWHAKECEFVLEKAGSDVAKDAKNCTFTLEDYVSLGKSEICVFKTHSRKTYRRLLKDGVEAVLL